ncbi:MAG TPA: hypothetical protein VE035_11030 [Puia sp.]|nr:hypothetical protein [Puia sp.]
MVKQIFSGLTVAFFLISCNSHPATKAGEDSLAHQQADSGQQKIAYNPRTFTIDPALLKKYQEACRHDTASYDRKFVSNFFELIKKFNGKRLDTTILTIGNLDGDLDQDTIFSRVYYDSGSIYVDAKWIKNHHVVWKDKYADPYIELNADLYDSTRPIWVSFAIGVIYGPPDFHSRNEMDSSGLSMVYEQGVDDLNSAGIHLDKEQYKAYLRDFKGDLLACGQPESRERLWIWYKPAGRMITYYQP